MTIFVKMGGISKKEATHPAPLNNLPFALFGIAALATDLTEGFLLVLFAFPVRTAPNAA
jgi:hypothetical protein